MAKVRHFRNSKRLRTIERLCERALLASDLGFSGFEDIPKEPDEMVQWDREHYATRDFAAHPPQAPLADTFFLHSRPTATKTIYLDFDGNITKGTSWNTSNNVATIVSPAYDPDGNGPSFTNAELTRIQGIWQRVAADFSAWDVNVTTQDPGEAALVNTGGSDTRWGMRVVTTVDNFANSGAGGFAYINSFNWGYESPGATDTPCFIFNTTEVSVAAAISHEVGHSLGLAHDGTNASHPSQPSAAYYNGHGTGETSWGPIMGVGGYYNNVTTWDEGTYFGSDNASASANFGRGPDDVAIITTFNGFGVIPDDYGGTTSSAATINYLGANLANPNLIDVSLFGTIGTRNDLDFFKFETGTGPINLTIDPYISELWTANSSGTFDRSIEPAFYGTSWANNQGTNLDVEAKLYDSTGALVATSNPTGLRASFTNLNLTAGTYYISVDGVGFGNPAANPPIGYTDYGSFGQYLVTGTIASLGVSLDLGAGAATYVENASPVPISPAATFTDSFGVNYDLLTMQATIVKNGESADRLSIIQSGSGVGQISTSGGRVSFGGVAFGTFTQSSSQLSVDLDAVATRAAVEALVRSIGYSSISDGPNPSARQVEFSFGLGVAKTRNVQIIPTNDSPTITSSSLPVIDEDVPAPIGMPIDVLLTSGFSDPDPGSRLVGIAIVDNSADGSTEGTWFYSSDRGGSWTAVGIVDDSSASLLVDSTTWIGFLPAPNYFGTPSPLKVRVLDDTFAGSFSNSVGDQRKFLAASTRGLTEGPVSRGTGNIEVSVRNINDAPVANTPSVQVNAVQDLPVNFKFDVQFPGLFTDIDSTNLTWTLTPIGVPVFPAWLKFDPIGHTLTGVPENADVGTHNFRLTVNDGFATASIPLTVVVANVNDAPQILGLSGQVVTENVVGARIGQLFSFDPDLNDTLSFFVSDSRFSVNDGALYLKSNASIDFERDPQITLTITATDNGSPSLSTSEVFTITVRDVNEFFPTFASQDLVIPFNRTNNQLLGTVQALDQDTQQIVKYNIQQDDARIFQIDPNSGELRLKSGAQVTEKSYRLFIGAYDNGTPSNSRVVLFNVGVEILNQFAPVLASGRNLNVPENSAAKAIVGKVVATDADGDTNLRYSTSSRQFTIDAATGVVAIADGTVLNFETQSIYVIPVDVTDSGSPSRTSSTAVTIAVQNVNDAPSGIRLVDSKVPTLQKGIELSQFVVTDDDPASKYTYATSDSRFEIRNEKLALRQSVFFAQALAGTSSTVNITVTDANDPTSSATLPLTFDISSNPFPWQNRKSALDVNTDGTISAIDALFVINALNSSTIGKGPLSTPREFSQLSLFYLDTSGDNVLSPIDALLVLNALNVKANGEGEPTEPADTTTVDPAPASIAPEAWFDAFTSLENERRRRG